MTHWLELLSTRASPALCRILVRVVAHAFALTVGDRCLLFCLPWEAAAAFPALTLSVTPFQTAPQARRELRRLKEEARNRHAIAVIWAYWLGSKVLDAHIPSLRPGVLRGPTLVS